MKILYLQSGRRKPIQTQKPIYQRDIQQDIPLGWCVACGQMLYVTEETLCRRCKGGKEYDQ